MGRYKTGNSFSWPASGFFRSIEEEEDGQYFLVYWFVCVCVCDVVCFKGRLGDWPG
jgi:hypothetical protein